MTVPRLQFCVMYREGYLLVHCIMIFHRMMMQAAAVWLVRLGRLLQRVSAVDNGVALLWVHLLLAYIWLADFLRFLNFILRPAPVTTPAMLQDDCSNLTVLALYVRMIMGVKPAFWFTSVALVSFDAALSIHVCLCCGSKQFPCEFFHASCSRRWCTDWAAHAHARPCRWGWYV